MAITVRAKKDPLGPLFTVMSVLLGCLVTLGAVGVLVTVTGWGTLTYFDTDEACVVVPTGMVPSGSVEVGEGDPMDPTFDKNVRTHPETIEVCDTGVSRGVHALAAGAALSGGIQLFIVLWATKNLIRAADRKGLFSTATAERTRRLGWTVLISAVLIGLYNAGVERIVVAGAVPAGKEPDWWWLLNGFSWPITSLLTGIGLITVGRVLHHAVVLQQHEDATI